MQKLQRFGGAMFTPVLLFAFSGIILAVAIILGYMTLKQGVVLQEKSEVTVPNLPLILSVMTGFLVLISLFVCFALIRITLA